MSLMNVSPECPEEYMGNTLDPKYRRPKTNADHIRSMTDEELARCLAVFVQQREDEATYMQTWLDWLKQLYKEDV